MEQPTAPQQVIYIIQMPKEKVANLKGSYLVKAATTLGGVHIVCGIAVLIASITGLVFHAFSIGILASVFFITTGGLTIGGARSGNKCLVVATLVMAIFSAIMACILLSFAGISMSMTYIGSEGFITSTIEMVIGGVMLIVGITSASLTCRPLCCPPSSSSSSQQGLVYYQAPNQVDIASLNLPLPTPLLSSAQVVVPPCAPPAYQEVVSFTNPLASEAGNLSNQEVAGSGSKKYQRF